MPVEADSDLGAKGALSGPPGIAALISFLLPAALLGGAYVSEYGFGLYPCEMCWWQRYPHFAALPLGVFALVALTRGAVGAARIASVLAAIAILISGLIGAFHAGVEYGWWEGVSACTNVPEMAAGEDFWKTMMDMPVVRCDRAAFTLFGISLAGYNVMLSAIGALAIFVLAGRREHGACLRVDSAGETG